MKRIRSFILVLLCLAALTFVVADETQNDPEPAQTETIEQPKGQPAAPPVGRLVIEVTGIKKQKGELRCRIYNSEENFPSKDEEKMFRLLTQPIEGKTATFIVDKVPLGQYGIIIHHDRNSDGKMNRHWYGPPKEPAAASNNAKGSFGPPKWKDAMIELNSNELIVPIEL